jgi:hypothetical protein
MQLVWMACVGLLLGSSSVAEAKQVKLASATASSEYMVDDTLYPVRYIKDGKSATAWFEGEEGTGLGSWVEVGLGGPVTVSKVVVYAGDWTSAATWKRANRPKEMEVMFSDGSKTTWSLTDEMIPQVFTPKTPTETSTIRFRITGAYDGTAFTDTGIAELMVFDGQDTNHISATAVASSELPPDGDTYTVGNMSDGLVDTYWCEGNKEGDGVGESLTFDFGRSVTIKTWQLLNGMGGSMSLHKQGNVATSATLKFSNGTTKAIQLKPFPLMQKVDLGGVTTNSVTVTFDAVRKGTDYNDMCISEAYFLP